ncbi:AMP-binding protein [Tsuneonella sp. YG55]|uniref:AMP-binding protein n=1 Tax=Tsuneonella litorea TaxID=2976475 RepID=A0A9X2W276_9SPHN|nr:AMP-binding protein [Tsuneonella litorea]MCT2559580.1 AMP-binding protein [Tsuneonella litorea]
MGIELDVRQQRLRNRFSPWTPLTLHGALDRAASEFPSRPALIADARTWTYAELAFWSRRLAAGLQRLGVTAGDKVAVAMANYPEFVALKYAIARAGAVAVPMNILNRQEEMRYVLEQSDAKLLVTMDAFRGSDYLRMLDAIAPGWETVGGGETLPKLDRVVVFSAEGEAAPRPHATPFAALDRDESEFRDVAVQPDWDCDILYTSGTTGSPKGVQLAHDMLTRTAFGSAYARAFEAGRRIVFSLPLYHVFGYVEGMLSVPFVGGAIIPQLRFDAHTTLSAIERLAATDALLIPAMSLAIVDAARERDYDLSSWRSALASGGRAPERLWADLFSVLGLEEVTTGYGMTETTASTTVTRPNDPIERLLTTNGRLRDVGPAGDPDMGDRLVDYRVIDPADGALLPPGETGELVARGPGVTRGYYNKPAETAAAFTHDGWLRTGDLGRIDADGYLVLLGRTKESYRCGGEQVLPSEVEDLLTSRADVAQAHVVPVADERMGEIGVAFVVASAGATLDPRELRDFVAARLARFKVPSRVIPILQDDIPTTASGRARKFLLVDLATQMVGQG